ncbi:hypothetical protein [Ferruginivarius sediminum]|uniref:Uncharacterized protein n=1 Tax=Ferruginivarius sediminum TaxID=2661937 RepID=A0A369T7Q4_9PROT|nr:hypothetical protein [Ferruginivarius sediminum]RDD60385.1 hypothetical protein DRB17_18290 [Ferruginivarius sediminum]
MIQDTVSFYFGAACVAVYAWDRFNKPRPLRHTTTWVQYRLAEVGYVIATLAVFAVLVWVIKRRPETVDFLYRLAGSDGEPAQGLSAPLVAALFLTVLLPNIPVLKSIDLKIKLGFQKLGAIPRRALSLSWRLNRLDFEIPRSEEGRVREFLTLRGIDPAPVLQAPAGTELASWRRAVAIYVMIRAYCDHFADTLKFRADEELERIDDEFDKTCDLVRIAMQSGDHQSASFDALAKQMPGLQRQLHTFASHVLLLGYSSMARVESQLERMGFQGVRDGHGLQLVNNIAAVGTTILVYFVIFFAIVVKVTELGSGDAFQRFATLAISIAVTIALAVAAALLLKRTPPAANKAASAPRRNVLRCWLAGLLAVVGWFVVQFVRKFVESDDGPLAVADALLSVWGWALIPFTIAFVISFLIDDIDGRSFRATRHLRLVEGAIVSAAYILAMSLALLALGKMSVEPGGTEGLFREVSYIASRLFSAGVLGFGLGYFVPEMYRATLRERAEEDAARQPRDGVVAA